MFTTGQPFTLSVRSISEFDFQDGYTELIKHFSHFQHVISNTSFMEGITMRSILSIALFKC